MSNILLQHADIITLDPDGRVLRDADLAITGDTIIAVGERLRTLCRRDRGCDRAYRYARLLQRAHAQPDGATAWLGRAICRWIAG